MRRERFRIPPAASRVAPEFTEHQSDAADYSWPDGFYKTVTAAASCWSRVADSVAGLIMVVPRFGFWTADAGIGEECR